ncbi:threonine/homoserine/homoserine lactone efflux protein [Pseudomonas duriflava]|uniref:Threonine/homoserine/homoserine lactone efflux protein n=1 Tax=Pseudomonas duriflava TaxID=459528 RepID=A0A562QAJ5_9PSED|nr:LysE family translocator [Pseudomonas duriflava]TWI53190.1 threonine/homoserine/homoserine lactone efflux protein [Pseudomonas duriflava]
MVTVNLLTFVVIATLLVISPGPNGILIAKTVPMSGHKAGLAAVWGFVAAFYIHGTLSIYGISVLLVQSAQAFFILKLLGAGYLFWIGIKSLSAAFKNEQNLELPFSKKRNSVSIRSAFAEGFLTNMLNPKVSMFYLAAFPQFLATGDSIYKAYFLVSTHAFINLVWFSAMVFLLSRLKGLATNANFIKWLKSVTGVVFIGFSANLAFLKP